ncbi:MAG: Hpt domain-containing protein, partial [Verrucomicrobia bacterium]|nr:Hpt domain-containing protein [Verrucomicrobiota bacterium]
MTDDEFLSKLREAFAIEADEHLRAITTGLLELEKSPAPAQRKEIVEVTFREAHSLKGAARAVNRTDIESICQAMESLFAGWKRQPGNAAPAETFDTLNRAVDLVAELLRLPDVASSPADKSAVVEMVRQLGAPASSSQAPNLKPQIPKPQAPPAPVVPEPAAPPPPAPAAPPLAAVPAAPTPAPEPPRPTATIRESPPAERAPVVADTVRIPTAKMDALLRQAEEMLAVKLTARQHAAELREMSDLLEAWRNERAKVRDAARSHSTSSAKL